MKHPGTQIRKDCIEKNGLTVTKSARLLHVDRQTLSNLVNERSGVSPEMAIRLEKVFGTSARDWMLCQLEFDYDQAMKRAAKINVAPFEASQQEKLGGQDE